MSNLTLCVLESEEMRIQFEEGVFEHFCKNGFQTWQQRTLIRTGIHRAKPNLPYDRMLLCGLVDENELIAAMAINLYVNEIVQMESLGFEIPYSKTAGDWCEGLVFFVKRRSFRGTVERFAVYKAFREYVFGLLLKRGIIRVVGSCSEELIPFHRMNGALIGEPILLDGEREYPLVFEIRI